MGPPLSHHHHHHHHHHHIQPPAQDCSVVVDDDDDDDDDDDEPVVIDVSLNSPTCFHWSKRQQLAERNPALFLPFTVQTVCATCASLIM